MQADIIDLSHHNLITDINKIREFGVVGIIHKATQGISFEDQRFSARRQMAKEAGLLFGAYHFGNGDNVTAQVDNFLSTVGYDLSNLLLCLDFEDSSTNPMRIDMAVKFIRKVEERTGKELVVYSGNTLKEKVGILSKEDKEYITSKRLWIAQYSDKVVLPEGFKDYWLHQYTDKGKVPGVAGNCDLNSARDLESLKEHWK